METVVSASLGMKATYQSIPLAQITPSPYQARKYFDEESLRGLSESMRHEGLIEPIVVRAVDIGYQLISGERRLRAAKLLGWEEIEAKIIGTVSEAEAAAKGLIENIQRQDLNPIEEAEGFLELKKLDAYWTQGQIAKVVGKGPDYISRSLALLDLPKDVVEKLRQRNLSREHGIELLRLNSANSQKGVANKIIKSGWSVKQTRAAIDRHLEKKQNSPSVGTQVPGTYGTYGTKVADPLEASWPGVQNKTKGWIWSAEYAAELTWSFTVNLEAMYPQGSLAPAALQKSIGQWFFAMAQSLGEGRADGDTKKQVEAVSQTPQMSSDIVQRAPQKVEAKTPPAARTNEEKAADVAAEILRTFMEGKIPGQEK